MEKVTKFNNKLVIIETSNLRQIKVYGFAYSLLLGEHLACIGKIQYNQMRREWCYYKSFNAMISFRRDYLIQLNQYLEDLNKK